MKKLFTLLAVTLLLPGAVFAASPTIIGTPVNGSTNGTAHTQSITVSGVGSNRGLVVVTWQHGGGTSPVSVKYDGTFMSTTTTMTAAQQINGNMYFLANPTAATADIVVTYSGSNTDTRVVAFVLQDVAQVSPLDISGQANSGSATSLSKAVVTSTDNTFVVTWIGAGTAPTTLNPDAGQTEIASAYGGPNGDSAVSWEEQTTAGSYTGGYSWDNATPLDLYVAALKYEAPNASANTTNNDASNWFMLLSLFPFALRRYEK